MRIDLTTFSINSRIRFLSRRSRVPVEVPHIITSLDTDTGKYLAYEVVDHEPLFHNGRPVMIRGTFGGPVDVSIIGED